VARPLTDPAVDMATLAVEIREAEERRNPNVVKVAAGFRDSRPGSTARALYFSRSPIPWPGAGDNLPLYHHIGIYAFRRASLARFVALPASPLEKREKLEQLRALEAGFRLDVTLVDSLPLGVDTPADLERARSLLASA
jgi:3-deoxy-manno-octulosonate cytidylyltransferase (CMP-KDO synthetase)